MVRRKVNQRKGVINEELLQRIDKMNDNKEFDPYASIKRTTILQEELFNNDDYELEDDDYVSQIENDKKESKLPIILTILFLLLLAIGAVYIFINVIK